MAVKVIVYAHEDDFPYRNLDDPSTIHEMKGTIRNRLGLEPEDRVEIYIETRSCEKCHSPQVSVIHNGHYFTLDCYHIEIMP